jgi:TorA maturation chaperone TorD
MTEKMYPMFETTREVSAGNQAALASTAQQVGHLYGFLASLYRAELTRQHLHALRQPEMVAMLKAAGIDLQGAFWSRPDAQLLEDLAVEFTSLFLGPGGHISPHESVQVEEHGGYWGDATTAVRRFITGTGIEYDPCYNGIPDHISVELEFLGELARREGLAWERGDTVAARNCLAYQRDFLDEHLGQWVEKFCTRVVETAELSFYRDVAQVTAEFVRSEISAVQERLMGVSAQADPPVAPVPVAEPEPVCAGVSVNTR